jgi:hypothetical protein
MCGIAAGQEGEALCLAALALTTFLTARHNLGELLGLPSFESHLMICESWFSVLILHPVGNMVNSLLRILREYYT